MVEAVNWSGDLKLESHFCQNYFGPIHLNVRKSFKNNECITLLLFHREIFPTCSFAQITWRQQYEASRQQANYDTNYFPSEE